MPDRIGRRELIKLTAGAALAGASAAAAELQPKFFTADEYKLVDELTELIIPADEKSGGARAAGVAGYIDATLAEAFEQEDRDAWRKGLASVDSLAAEMHGSPFLKCPAEQRAAILARMARSEQHPTKPEELFFAEIKSRTIHAYYSSSIGIHDDIGYLGNTYQRGDFAGFLPGEK